MLNHCVCYIFTVINNVESVRYNLNNVAAEQIKGAWAICKEHHPVLSFILPPALVINFSAFGILSYLYYTHVPQVPRYYSGIVSKYSNVCL